MHTLVLVCLVVVKILDKVALQSSILSEGIKRFGKLQADACHKVLDLRCSALFLQWKKLVCFQIKASWREISECCSSGEQNVAEGQGK